MSLSRESAIFKARKRWRALIHKRSAISQSSQRHWPFFADTVQFERGGAFIGAFLSHARGIDGITARGKLDFRLF